MKNVRITTEYITLGQLLKLLGIISYGSDAKRFLNETQVLVNNESETRRGRKLYNKDTVTVNNQIYKIEE